MKNKNLVLKVDHQSVQHTRYLNKIIGTIDLKNLAKLINAVGLEANPRKSKVCNTTDQIRDTLEYNPAMFKYSSKGLLVSSSECHKLERGRLNLTYNNESIEGYALLLSPSNDGIVVPSKATAIKPGRTTTTGISILRKPANIKPF